MPTVHPIKDRTAGCMSTFLVNHHKEPIEIKVDVARIRWSSCIQGEMDILSTHNCGIQQYRIARSSNKSNIVLIVVSTNLFSTEY